MSKTDLPILYSFRRCPYAMRARLALKLAGQQVQLREIVLRNKPEHMLEISPKGTVPVLLLPDDKVIDESLDVMQWALAKNDPDQLMPTDKALHNEIFALIAENDGPFKRHLDRTKYAARYPDEDPEINRTKASEFLQTLENRLANHPYLFGEKPTITDIAIAPFVRQFANIDRDWFNAQPWPNLINWLNRFLESELFASVMEKYEPWQQCDEPILFGEPITENA